MTIIEDGTGDGFDAKVNSANQLETFSVSRNEMTNVSISDGDTYLFASGDFINITTTGTETGFLYVKNTSATKNLHIQSIRSCGDTIQKWKVFTGVTTGTLVSAATAGSSNNINQTSSNSADVTVYKGVDGSTRTNGTMIEHWINNVGHSIEVFDGAMVLGRNDSITLTLETDTAGDYCARVIGYYEDVE